MEGPLWPPEPSRRSSLIAASASSLRQDAKEYFFHRNSLDSSLDFDRLNGGEAVTFEIEDSPKGPRASKVSAA